MQIFKFLLLQALVFATVPLALAQNVSCKAASCIPVMLQSISPLNEARLNAAADLALNKDAFPKGNRKDARKLNEDALKELNSGNAQSAINLLKQAVDKDPSDVEINSNYGFALLKTGNYAGAKTQLQKTLELNPRRTSTWLPLAESYAGTGQAQLANQAGLIAYHYSTDKAKAKSYYQKQAQEQSIAPIRSLYATLVSEIGKLDSVQQSTAAARPLVPQAHTAAPAPAQAPVAVIQAKTQASPASTIQSSTPRADDLVVAICAAGVAVFNPGDSRANAIFKLANNENNARELAVQRIDLIGYRQDGGFTERGLKKLMMDHHSSCNQLGVRSAIN